MAERVGFEPTVEFPLHTLSKRAPSTARTSLREKVTGLGPVTADSLTIIYFRRDSRHCCLTVTVRLSFFYRSTTTEVYHAGFVRLTA